MDQQATPNVYRLTFLDNLRSLMVVLVLIFHAGASYSSAVDFWPFHDGNTSEIIDIFLFLCDVFMMAVLFFIAGYFTLPSFDKRGFWRFLGNKIVLLGIPWLIVTILVLPVLDYIHYRMLFTVGETPAMNFGIYWMLSMKKIAEFHVGWMDMTTYRSMTDHFYQRYMWFLSLLLLFFTVFAILYMVNKKFEFIKHQASASKKSKLSVLVRTGLLTILLFAVVKLFIYPELLDTGWFSLGNLIQFQLGKLMIYAVYFGLGIYAYSREWFKDGTGIERPWVWGLFCFLLFVTNMLIFRSLSSNDSPLIVFQLAHVVFYPLWTLSLLGLFLAFAFKHWNRITPLNKTIAANSYNMYLVHYIFPMTIPLLLVNVEVASVIVKFGIVAIITVLFSYLISYLVIKPFPRLTIIGIIALSAILAVLI